MELDRANFLEQRLNRLEDENQRLREENSSLQESLRSLHDVDPTMSPDKKRQRIASIAPSSIKWSDLVNAGLVEQYELFVSECSDNSKNLPEMDTKWPDIDKLSEIHQTLLSYGTPSSEGYSMLVVGLFIAIAAKMSEVNFSVLPAVYLDPDDSRRNKYADYMLLKMKNKKTYVVVELKKSTNVEVKNLDSTHLAQLLQEINFVHIEEKMKKIIGIYGNYSTLHIFVFELRLPYKCIAYYFINTATIFHLPPLLYYLIKQIM